MNDIECAEIVREAAYERYDRVARSLPDCSHNREWEALGPGRPQPPACPENVAWRTVLRAAWLHYLSSNDAYLALEPADVP